MERRRLRRIADRLTQSRQLPELDENSSPHSRRSSIYRRRGLRNVKFLKTNEERVKAVNPLVLVDLHQPHISQTSINESKPIRRVNDNNNIGLEMKVKSLEEKLPYICEDVKKVKKQNYDIQRKVDWLQKQLDYTKDAYAELLYNELNKSNVRLKLEELARREYRPEQHTDIEESSENKV